MASVLIVDDEQHIRLLIEQTLEPLEDEGVELLTAGDGETALSVIEHHRPDLVFLDVMMPKRNGFEVCRAIKRDLGLQRTFVVMLTAKGQAYDREQGLEVGRRVSHEAVRPGPAARAGAPGARRGQLMSVDLKRLIVRHRHVAPMLSALLGGTQAAVRISDAEGSVILERDTSRLPDPPDRFPIVVEGATVGWVDGDRIARAVAAVLSYASAREADKRSLAREALDRYRELNMVYDLAERLSSDLGADAIVALAEQEAGRLVPGGRGLLREGVGDGIIGAVALNGVAEIVNICTSDGRATNEERAFASLAVAPVTAHGKQLGVLCVASQTPREMMAAGLKLLTAIAAIVGPSLERARGRAAIPAAVER